MKHCRGGDEGERIAKTIEEVTRNTDMTFRYGGEEFAVVLTKTAQQGAALIAERVRKTIDNLQISTESGMIKTSVSIGCSTLKSHETIKSLFAWHERSIFWHGRMQLGMPFLSKLVN